MPTTFCYFLRDLCVFRGLHWLAKLEAYGSKQSSAEDRRMCCGCPAGLCISSRYIYRSFSPKPRQETPRFEPSARDPIGEPD